MPRRKFDPSDHLGHDVRVDSRGHPYCAACRGASLSRAAAARRPKVKGDCRFTAGADCDCPTHLPAGYWLRLERNARRFADEQARLDETDPAEARRRDAELLARPAAALGYFGGAEPQATRPTWRRCTTCGLGHERRRDADACCSEVSAQAS